MLSHECTSGVLTTATGGSRLYFSTKMLRTEEHLWVTAVMKRYSASTLLLNDLNLLERFPVAFCIANLAFPVWLDELENSFLLVVQTRSWVNEKRVICSRDFNPR